MSYMLWLVLTVTSFAPNAAEVDRSACATCAAHTVPKIRVGSSGFTTASSEDDGVTKDSAAVSTIVAWWSRWGHTLAPSPQGKDEA